MSFTSYTWVAHEETKEALRAAETYLAVAVIGGLVMLMGLFLLYGELGTLEFTRLAQAAEKSRLNGNGGYVRIFTASVCLLFGFGAKAGVFPLHIWLPKAHPVAPAPASALLSGILTKAGIFGVLVISCAILPFDACLLYTSHCEMDPVGAGYVRLILSNSYQARKWRADRSFI